MNFSQKYVAFHQKHKYFFYTKLGISITLLAGLLGLIMFVLFSLSAYKKGDITNTILCLLYALFFLYSFGNAILKILRYNQNKQKYFSS